MQQEPRPGEHGHKRSSASRVCAVEAGSWHSDSERPPPHFDHQRGSRCLRTRIEKLNIWKALKWRPSSNDVPGTAAGTVRLRAVTVAMATSWGVYFLVQECPAVTMFGLSRVPSRYTWWSERALYTAARTLVGNFGSYFWWIIWLCFNCFNCLFWEEAYLLSGILAPLQIMISVWEDLRLYNGYQAILKELRKK